MGREGKGREIMPDPGPGPIDEKQIMYTDAHLITEETKLLFSMHSQNSSNGRKRRERKGKERK
jgi:hypothetical protein